MVLIEAILVPEMVLIEAMVVIVEEVVQIKAMVLIVQEAVPVEAVVIMEEAQSLSPMLDFLLPEVVVQQQLVILA